MAVPRCQAVRLPDCQCGSGLSASGCSAVPGRPGQTLPKTLPKTLPEALSKGPRAGVTSSHHWSVHIAVLAPLPTPWAQRSRLHVSRGPGRLSAADYGASQDTVRADARYGAQGQTKRSEGKGEEVV